MIQNRSETQSSLIGRKISLITHSNSLQACKDFPVRMRRELRSKPLSWLQDCRDYQACRVSAIAISLYFPS